ncbi:helix-loop-helix protein delilah-like [Limulus polyphemus]|uniref:Helix-loop-helix protein delilah-like n=1 Tax=Limulus polyphemus TaxID=6850 RepID=A0ABM1C541_LIMPO|nr:helix-loop-helix protein delilah-like [Limulus polyphemus]
MSVGYFDPNSWESLLSLGTAFNYSDFSSLQNSYGSIEEVSAKKCIHQTRSLEDNQSLSPTLSNTSAVTQENRISTSDKTNEQNQQLKPEGESREIKYKLRPRSIQNRKEIENKRFNKKEPKLKQKPPPLSKYRRRTANARERFRMDKMNQAFEQLRLAIPKFPSVSSKLTKIKTLQLAVHYIAALSDVLHKSDANEKQEAVGGLSLSIDPLEMNLNLDSDDCDLTVGDLNVLLESDESTMDYNTEFEFI